MKISLPWGTEQLDVTLPDSWSVIFPERTGGMPSVPPDPVNEVEKALRHPIASQPISAQNLAGKKVLVVVDDNTRPTPASFFLKLVLDELEAAGAVLKQGLLLPGLGIHTSMTEAEMLEKVGRHNLERIPWENHDAFSQAQNDYFGTTVRGTPIYLNRHVKEADFIVTIGMVEPHLWAGFGGGLKNILPGLASAETIGIHHAIIAEPPYKFNRVGLPPEENDFRLDLEEVGKMIDAPIFCLNVVLNHEKKILRAFAGDPIACHRKAVRFNNEISGLALERQVDGILTNSYPMEINFKQSMKAVGNALPAVKPGGVVMAFLRAERGLDDIPLPEKSTPLWLVKRILRTLGPSRVLGFLEKVRKGQNVEEKFLTYYSMQLIRQNELYFYVPTLSREEVKRLGFFEQFPTPQAVIARARKKLGSKAQVAVFLEGGATYPIVGE